MPTKKSGNSKSKKNSESVKRRTSSIIRNIFGSSYKKQLAIKKAQEDASKLKNKNQVMRFISEARKNKVVQNSKNLPILLYTIILALNKLGKYAPQKNIVLGKILASKVPLTIKLNHLIRLFQNQISSDIINIPDKPESLFGFYDTIKQIKKLIEGKGKNKDISLKDPEVYLNVIVFTLNARKIYNSIGNDDIYTEYFKSMNEFLKKNDPDDLSLSLNKQLEKDYILLLQDILLCDIGSDKCGTKTTKFPPKNLCIDKNNTYYECKSKNDFYNFISRLDL